MDARHAAALALRGMCAVGILLTVSCGGGGGGGGECSTLASTSECGPGEICSNIQGDGNQCRRDGEDEETERFKSHGGASWQVRHHRWWHS